MNFKIFCNANYLGEFTASTFYDKNEIIALGSLISIDADKYCVRNVMVRKNGDIVLEVNK